jgi:hypothetical protein
VVRRFYKLAHNDTAPLLHAYSAELESLLHHVARKLLFAQLREATLQRCVLNRTLGRDSLHAHCSQSSYDMFRDAQYGHRSASNICRYRLISN